MTTSLPWWQKTTIYQIYPRSFQDSNGDGIGDLPGIISRLDYIRDLGFETIWISPFFASPQRDHGYDISDYRQIAPEYGTMEDARKLIREVHRRKMRIIFDMVMNHTSEEHAWFQESRSDRENPRRNWYLWRPGKRGLTGRPTPPNNWKSMVGNTGWIYDEKTEEWYFSNFLPFQPDLNFRNPEVKVAMFDTCRFWLEKGVDGFRLDIFNAIYKDELFRDNPFSFRFIPSEDNNDEAFFQKKIYNFNHPDNYELARELRAVCDEYNGRRGERMLLGEVSGSPEKLKGFLGEKQDGLHTIFLFQAVRMRYRARFFYELIEHIEEQYPPPFTPVYVLGNHDFRRWISRIGNREDRARLVALIQLTARGIPVVYYGEEIGMVDAPLSHKTSEDPIARMYRLWPEFLVRWTGVFINRMRSRTPMQWDPTPQAGFTWEDTRPWLPVTGGFGKRNAQTQSLRLDSLWNTYRSLLKIRSGRDSLNQGRLFLLRNRYPKKLLSYLRYLEPEDQPVKTGRVRGRKNKTGDQRGEWTLVLIHFGKKKRLEINFQKDIYWSNQVPETGPQPISTALENLVWHKILYGVGNPVLEDSQITLEATSAVILAGETA